MDLGDKIAAVFIIGAALIFANFIFSDPYAFLSSLVYPDTY